MVAPTGSSRDGPRCVELAFFVFGVAEYGLWVAGEAVVSDYERGRQLILVRGRALA